MNRKLKAKIVEKFGTQSDFANVVSVDETLVSKIVRGRRELPEDTKRAWADALGSEISEIFFD
jgi:transcriptional regulator with XRE-family HTH domain